MTQGIRRRQIHAIRDHWQPVLAAELCDLAGRDVGRPRRDDKEGLCTANAGLAQSHIGFRYL